jgi:hypothetical protein
MLLDFLLVRRKLHLKMESVRSSETSLDFARLQDGGLGSISRHVGFMESKMERRKFSPSTSVSPAHSHSINCFRFINPLKPNDYYIYQPL